MTLPLPLPLPLTLTLTQTQTLAPTLTLTLTLTRTLTSCPIGARARRIDEPVLRITIDPVAGPITVSELSGMQDYNSPLAPGALPKCALHFCGVSVRVTG